jgi:dTDP-4-dehydrorhamnose reductase
LHKFQYIPFVYISSEYAKNPVNIYSASKYAGELAVKYFADKHLIIRTLFKPSPWPWKYAFTDQMTQGDYVEIIASLIVREIDRWDKKDSKTVYVGTGRKNMYELALRTAHVIPVSLKDFRGVRRPYDYI